MVFISFLTIDLAFIFYWVNAFLKSTRVSRLFQIVLPGS